MKGAIIFVRCGDEKSDDFYDIFYDSIEVAGAFIDCLEITDYNLKSIHMMPKTKELVFDSWKCFVKEIEAYKA